MSVNDAFARSSAARAWKAAREAEAKLQGIIDRLERIENHRELRLSRCGYCGEWTNGPGLCRNHIDLLSTADVLAEALRK